MFMRKIMLTLSRMPPALMTAVILGLAVAVTFLVANVQAGNYEKICEWADAHHGRVESYVEHYGETPYTRYRVWLPDGSFVPDSDLQRHNYR